jgi:AefR-like transcriptional repressor, C-terminal domain
MKMYYGASQYGEMSQPGYPPLVRMIIAEAPRFPRLGTLFFSTATKPRLAIITALIQEASDQQLIAARWSDTHVAWRAVNLCLNEPRARGRKRSLRHSTVPMRSLRVSCAH